MAEEMVPVDDPGYIYLTRKPTAVHRARHNKPKSNVDCGLRANCGFKTNQPPSLCQRMREKLGKSNLPSYCTLVDGPVST